TCTPAARRVSTVIWMWGVLGNRSPVCRRVRPRSKRGAASSRALTNCELADASIPTSPPGTLPVPTTVNGRLFRPPCSTWMPSSAMAWSKGVIGRARARSSPSKCTGPSASAATAGTNRRTVPARPQSMLPPPRRRAGGVSTQVPSPWVRSTRTPSCSTAPTISSASRDTSGWCSVVAPSARAASSRCRLVSDLLPGTTTVPVTGPRAAGAAQTTDRSEGQLVGDRGSGVLGGELGLEGGDVGGVLGAPRQSGCPGGVKGGQQDATEQTEVAEELLLLRSLHLGVGLLPEAVLEDRGGHQTDD